MLTPQTVRGARSDSGAVAIVVAVFAIVMFALASLVVDLGIARDTRRQAQNAADASALAAAGALYAAGSTPDFNAATVAAKSYATANFGTSAADWSGCTTTSSLTYAPSTPCISYDSATSPNQVRVVMPGKAVASFFGGIVGYQGMRVAARAQATLNRGSRPVCSFCVLGTGSHDLQNGNLIVQNGDMWLNGSVTLGSNAQLSAPAGTVYIHGTVDQPQKVVGTLVQGSDVVADPLATMALPSVTGLSVKTDPCSQGPGRYGAVSISGSGSCTLAPGLYVFTEPLSIGGTKAFTATGVTLFFTCGSGGVVASCTSDVNPGALDQGGSGAFTLTAPTSGALKGLAVVYERTNSALVSLKGSGTLTLSGTIYAPASTFDIRGGSCVQPQQTMVVTADVRFSGNGSCFNTSYVPSLNVDLPPPAAGLVL